jgi:hypothetical protein
MGTPTLDLLNRRQFLTPLTASTRKAISGTVAQLGPMSPGSVYYLTADADCFFRQGAVGMTAPTTSTGDPLWAKERAEIHCSDGTTDAYVDVITSGGTGTAYLTRAD